MASCGPAASDNEDTELLLYKPADCQIHDQCLVDGGVEGDIKLVIGPSKGGCHSFLYSSIDFILNDGGEEIGLGESFLDSLTVSAFQGIQDSGESELLEHSDEFRHGIHVRILLSEAGFSRERKRKVSRSTNW